MCVCVYIYIYTKFPSLRSAFLEMQTLFNLETPAIGVKL